MWFWEGATWEAIVGQSKVGRQNSCIKSMFSLFGQRTRKLFIKYIFFVFQMYNSTVYMAKIHLGGNRGTGKDGATRQHYWVNIFNISHLVFATVFGQFFGSLFWYFWFALFGSVQLINKEALNDFFQWRWLYVLVTVFRLPALKILAKYQFVLHLSLCGLPTLTFNQNLSTAFSCWLAKSSLPILLRRMPFRKVRLPSTSNLSSSGPLQFNSLPQYSNASFSTCPRWG